MNSDGAWGAFLHVIFGPGLFEAGAGGCNLNC